MPFPMMVAMSKLWNTQFFGFYDADTPCGLIFLASNRKIVFVMFFAVDECLRSKGYGSFILQQIRNKYPDKKIIITIEPCDDNAPDIGLRKRRKLFYLRNGYKETGYRIKLNGVVQEIIITNGEFMKREFCSFSRFTVLAVCILKYGNKNEQHYVTPHLFIKSQRNEKYQIDWKNDKSAV